MGTIYRIILGIIVSTFVIAVVIMLASEPETVVDLINVEIDGVGDVLGDDVEIRVVKKTESEFSNLASAIRFTTSFLYEKGDPTIAKNPGMTGFFFNYREWFQGVIETFWNLVYQSMLRLNIALEVCWYMVAILVPAVVDGLMVRKVKINSFGYTSPLFYQFSFIGLAALISGWLIILAYPSTVPIWVYTVWVLVFAYVTRMIACNLQKMV